MVLTVDLPLFTLLGFTCRCYTVQLQLFLMPLYILSAFSIAKLYSFFSNGEFSSVSFS